MVGLMAAAEEPDRAHDDIGISEEMGLEWGVRLSHVPAFILEKSPILPDRPTGSPKELIVVEIPERFADPDESERIVPSRCPSIVGIEPFFDLFAADEMKGGPGELVAVVGGPVEE